MGKLLCSVLASFEIAILKQRCGNTSVREHGVQQYYNACRTHLGSLCMPTRTVTTCQNTINFKNSTEHGGQGGVFV